MRRQARISIGGALVVRSASALQVWLWLLIFVFQNEFRISRSIQPGYLDFDNLPETNFTCAGKVIGGYYADLETSCQMFHVCTVGQQDEPMDIKFLCLNGTVFDQYRLVSNPSGAHLQGEWERSLSNGLRTRYSTVPTHLEDEPKMSSKLVGTDTDLPETRVCERVDEVDCTKSEKFYSLNLELYGSTAPPIIQPEVSSKPQTNPTEQSYTITTKTSTEDLSDPFVNETPTVANDKTQDISADTLDSTDDPIQDVKKEEQKVSKTPSTQTVPVSNVASMNDEYRVEDDIDDEYEEFYSHPSTTSNTPSIITTSTTTQPPVSRTSTTTSTTRRPYSTSSSISSQAPMTHSSTTASTPLLTTIDPSLLSPQEFIYRHRGPGSEAISFQRQSFRPADGVFITHAPPQQFDHFQYESSRTAPRPVSRPTPFVQRPQPFRTTTHDPRDQILRPGPASQSSERHETSVKHRSQPYPSALPSQQTLPFNFYYDRKRSDDLSSEKDSPPSARSVAPPTIPERPFTKPKSPPRVIVTASASVSDSNGKKLNYTVGNVVSAVKPIVAINYDDYKESDLIFDPFFLDVPKLNKRRKTRSSRHRKIFTVPATATIPTNLISKSSIESTLPPATSRATTVKIAITTPTTTTTAAAWNPEDYVDDNYEPHAYLPPIPPLAVLVSQERVKHTNAEKESRTGINKDELNQTELTSKNVGRKDESRPTPSAVQMISSQSSGVAATARDVTPSAPPYAPAQAPSTPLQAPACASSRSSDCRNRA